MSASLGRTRDTLVIAFVALLASLTFGAASAWALPDFDGDGVAPPADCDNLDASTKPGALDKPDTSFVDSNCDGIDGAASKAIFVAVSGSNLASGTQANPVQTINKGIELANAAVPKKDVYVAGGTYNEVVNLVSGVSIFGGYAPISGVRNGSETTIVSGNPAILADNDNGVTLQLLTLRGTLDGSGNNYAIRAINNSKLFTDKVTAQGQQAANGANGGPGGTGGFASGFGGSAGGAGGCGSGVGGAIGSVPILGTGGFNVGGTGLTGSTGTTAGNLGAPGAPDLTAWSRPFAGSGSSGGPGGGGQGGRGGSGATNLIPLCGGNGGGGGTGGGGGGGGGGGQSGGASFGALISNSAIVASASRFTGGPAGTGGNGGNRGGGGSPSGGGGGLIGQCFSFFQLICAQNGFAGGAGGPGGQGGSGGGAPGGPSAGVYQSGATSGYTPKNGTTEAASTAALGGFQGNGGPRAASGLSAARQRTATAPATSTSDFDGDGVNDTADACPAESAPGSGNGCVVRPGKLADNDGDDIPNSSDACPDTHRGPNDANEDGCPDAVDNDGDGFPSTVDCNDGNAGINPSRAEVAENGVDENCDGVDGVNLDRDADGFPRPADCNDNNPNIKPGVTDIVDNNIDENCDGADSKSEPATRIVVSMPFFVKKSTNKFTTFTQLQVKGIPQGSTLKVTCKAPKGKKCPGGKSFTKRNARGTVSLKKWLKKKLAAGTKLTARVTKRGNFIGAVKIMTIKKKARPSFVDRCIPPGKTKAGRC